MVSTLGTGPQPVAPAFDASTTKTHIHIDGFRLYQSIAGLFQTDTSQLQESGPRRTIGTNHFHDEGVPMNKSDIQTYLEMSSKYIETVCTAGVLADTKKMVRLYSIRFRYLEGAQQFRKYQWIRAAISKAVSNPRPESYNIDPNSIEAGDVTPASRSWEERCAWLLNDHTVFPSVEALREDQKQNGTSLGIVKPKAVKRVFITNRKDRQRPMFT